MVHIQGYREVQAKVIVVFCKVDWLVLFKYDFSSDKGTNHANEFWDLEGRSGNAGTCRLKL